jgi:hypothetical protein
MYSLVKDDLVLSITLAPMTLHWVALLVLNMNYDLVIWLMEYAINIKRWLFSNILKGG